MRRQIDWTLYLVTDQVLCRNLSIDDVVSAAVRGGVTAVQLREKDCTTRSFVELGKKLKSILDPLKVPLLINDRVDIALACEADGVHLGQSDLKYQDARKILGPNALIGLSVETFEQAIEAEQWDADYLGVSPVFETSTKKNLTTAWRIEGLSHLRKHSRHKLVGIGGIHSSNVADVITAGADGVAVVSAICGSDDPESSARGLREKIESSRKLKSEGAI